MLNFQIYFWLCYIFSKDDPDGTTAGILTMILLDVILNLQIIAEEKKIKRGQEETSVRIWVFKAT